MEKSENMELTLIDQQIKNLDLEVKEGETLDLNLASFTSFPGVLINVKVAEGASFNGAFADFSRGEGTFKINVSLLGPTSACNWHLACLSDKEDKKVFDTSVNHNGLSQQGNMSNYGICLGSSKLTFAGVSKIEKGSKKTSTRQVAKIIVFDPLADGKCSPILKIDESDVEASHAAVVGRLNDDHLFYLESRGIPLDEAKKLLTFGYLKPIEAFFKDEELVKKIDSCIEEGI